MYGSVLHSRVAGWILSMDTGFGSFADETCGSAPTVELYNLLTFLAGSQLFVIRLELIVVIDYYYILGIKGEN